MFNAVIARSEATRQSRLMAARGVLDCSHDDPRTSGRIAKFGRGATILRSRGVEALDDGQIATVAPSVFATGKHVSRSERYTYIPTSEVLRGLRREGFMPFEVRQGGSRMK
jgi:hypothetical protein